MFTFSNITICSHQQPNKKQQKVLQTHAHLTPIKHSIPESEHFDPKNTYLLRPNPPQYLISFCSQRKRQISGTIYWPHRKERNKREIFECVPMSNFRKPQVLDTPGEINFAFICTPRDGDDDLKWHFSTTWGGQKSLETIIVFLFGSLGRFTESRFIE